MVILPVDVLVRVIFRELFCRELFRRPGRKGRIYVR